MLVKKDYLKLNDGKRHSVASGCDIEVSKNTIVSVTDHSSVVSYDGSVINAYDRSTVHADGHSVVNAFHLVTVYAHKKSIIKAHDNSVVIIVTGHPIVELHDRAVCIDQRRQKPIVLTADTNYVGELLDIISRDEATLEDLKEARALVAANILIKKD